MKKYFATYLTDVTSDEEYENAFENRNDLPSWLEKNCNSLRQNIKPMIERETKTLIDWETTKFVNEEVTLLIPSGSYSGAIEIESR